MPPERPGESPDEETRPTARREYESPAICWQEDLSPTVQELAFACAKISGQDGPCTAAPAS